MRFNTLKLHRGLLRWINCDHLVVFNAPRNFEHTGVLAFRHHQKSGLSGLESNPCPWAWQHNAIATVLVEFTFLFVAMCPKSHGTLQTVMAGVT